MLPNFNNGQSNTRRLRCASDTTNPKSKIENPKFTFKIYIQNILEIFQIIKL